MNFICRCNCFGLWTTPVQPVTITPSSRVRALPTHIQSTNRSTTSTVRMSEAMTPGSPVTDPLTPDYDQKIRDLLKSELLIHKNPRQVQTMDFWWETGVCKIVFSDESLWYRQISFKDKLLLKNPFLELNTDEKRETANTDDIIRRIVKDIIASGENVEISVSADLIKKISDSELLLNNVQVHIMDFFQDPEDASKMIVLLLSDKRVLHNALSALNALPAEKQIGVENALGKLRKKVGIVIPNELIRVIQTKLPAVKVFQAADDNSLVVLGGIEQYETAICALSATERPELEEVIDNLRMAIKTDISITVPWALVKEVKNSNYFLLNGIQIHASYIDEVERGQSTMLLPNKKRVCQVALTALESFRSSEKELERVLTELRQIIKSEQKLPTTYQIVLPSFLVIPGGDDCLLLNGTRIRASLSSNKSGQSILYLPNEKRICQAAFDALKPFESLESALTQLHKAVYPELKLPMANFDSASYLSTPDQISPSAPQGSEIQLRENTQEFLEKNTLALSQRLRELQREKPISPKVKSLRLDWGCGNLVCTINFERNSIHRKISAENFRSLQADNAKNLPKVHDSIIQEILLLGDRDCLELSIPANVLRPVKEGSKVVYFETVDTPLPVHDVFRDLNDLGNYIVLFERVAVVYETIRELKKLGWEVSEHIIKSMALYPIASTMARSADIGVAFSNVLMVSEGKGLMMEGPVCQADLTIIEEAVLFKLNEKFQTLHQGAISENVVKEVKIYLELGICKILRKGNKSYHCKINTHITTGRLDANAIVKELLDQPQLIEIVIFKDLVAHPKISELKALAHQIFANPENSNLQILHFYPQGNLHAVLRSVAAENLINIAQSDLESIRAFCYTEPGARVLRESEAARRKLSFSQPPLELTLTPPGEINSLIIRSRN